MQLKHKSLFWTIIEFVEKNISNDKLIDEIVKKTGYSKRYIYKVFKCHANINIGTYIRKRRLTKAALLVKYTRKTIGDISIELNFSSQQSFCRAFKKQFMTSPSEYRLQKGMSCKELFGGLSMKNYSYTYNIVFRKSIMLNTTTLKYRENILKYYCRRGACLKLRTIMKLSEKSRCVYVSSTTQLINDKRKIIDVTSFVGVHSNNSNYCTYSGFYAEFEFNGKWVNYLEYSRGCFSALNEIVAPYPVIEKITIHDSSIKHDPNCNILMYIPIIR